VPVESTAVAVAVTDDPTVVELVDTVSVDFAGSASMNISSAFRSKLPVSSQEV
jgi:hypothetical protein